MHREITTHPHVSKRDLYILSRLNATVTECNSQLKDYTFGLVSSALHSFFLYDFCDLYLELVKPIVQTSRGEDDGVTRQGDPGQPASGRKWCAQATLYTCLEQVGQQSYIYYKICRTFIAAILVLCTHM